MKPKPNKAKENPSFASVVNGVVALNGKSSIDKGIEITLQEHDLIQVENITEVLLLKVKEVDTMRSIYRVCRMKVSIISRFMTLVDYSGLPLCAWGSTAYKKVASIVESKEEERSMESNDKVPDDIEADIPTKFDLDQQGPTFADTSNHPNNLGNQKAKANEEEENDKNETNANNKSDKSCPPGFKHMKQSISCHSHSSFTKNTSGRLFTLMNEAGTKMSKLNRFLILESVSDSILDPCVTVLDWLWLDHNLVMFHVSKVDYRPIPFKFFHSWLHRNNLDEVIKSGYLNALDSSFHSKLKSLKQCVKEWHLNIKYNECSRKHEISTLLKEIEIILDACGLRRKIESLESICYMSLMSLKSFQRWMFFKNLVLNETTGSKTQVLLMSSSNRRDVFINEKKGITSEWHWDDYPPSDDVVIVTEWSNHDMDNLKRVLRVFHLAFGLKINMHKSDVFGVRVLTEDVVDMAHGTGIYHMSIFKLPETTIRTLKHIRASFFWGGIEDRKKMAWVKWDSALASLDKGGLGVGSLKAFNLALLLKWSWRFVNNPNGLWSRLIKAIHGKQAGFDFKRWET
ncbi:hypothetical protein Tco_1084026 [Tanacetum coccineum]